MEKICIIEKSFLNILRNESMEDLKLKARLKDRLITAHLALVDKISHSYKSNVLEDEDIVGYGRVGLIHAFDRFDPDKGYAFSTYSSWWIRQAIMRGIAEERKIDKIPVNVLAGLVKLEKAKEQYTKKYNRAPTVEELASYVGKSPIQVGNDLALFYRQVVSIDSLLDTDEEEQEGDNFVGDPDSMKQFDDLLDKLDSEKLMSEIDLSPRNRGLLYKKWGLNGNPESTLDEVGKEYKITRERVRQIADRSLKIIRLKVNQDLERRLSFETKEEPQ